MATSRDLTLADTITKAKVTEIEKLEKRENIDFDRTYVRLLNSEQSELASSVRQLRRLRNEEVSKFANDHLPVLKDNLSNLKKLRDSLPKRSDKTARKERSA
jgi:hypothetical protein